MLEIAIEPSSYAHLVVGFRVGQPLTRFILPKISLLFDKIHYFGKPHGIELLEDGPYGEFSDISNELIGLIGKYPLQSEGQLDDVRMALGDPSNAEGGHYAYSGIRALLDYAKQRACYLYVPPGMREGFIEFCVNYEPDYLPIIKKGFLLCSILEYIFDNEIPAFDPIKAQQALASFVNYKNDFQNGLLDYLNQFEGHYMLSGEQERFIGENLARDEKLLLDFLKPENLKKYNIPEIAGKFILGLLSLPLPIDSIYEGIKKFKEVRDFKNANLDFILSIFLIKQLSNIMEIEMVTECTVCALSTAEIENMSEKQSDDVINSSKLCEKHMVGRIDLRKRFRLHGKQLLKEMKRLGDLSIFISSEK